MRNPRRGEIYYIDFGSPPGAEIAGPHPALVIQNDVGNQASQLTIVAAITSNLRVARLPVGVEISPEESGLRHQSVVHLGQIYTVDQERLEQTVGMLPESSIEKVNRAIATSLGLTSFRIPT